MTQHGQQRFEDKPLDLRGGAQRGGSKAVYVVWLKFCARYCLRLSSTSSNEGSSLFLLLSFFLFMLSMAAEPAFLRKASASTTLLSSKCRGSKRKTWTHIQLPLCSSIRASYSMDEDKNRVYKQLGQLPLSLVFLS